MKILIITPIFPPDIGGPATYTAELSKRLSQDHQVTIITFGHYGGMIDGRRIITIPLYQDYFGRIRRQWELAKSITTEVKRNDLLYAQGALVVGFIASLISSLSGKPLIIKFVGDEVWEEALRRQQTSLQLEEFLAANHQPFLLSFQKKLQAISLKIAKKVIVPSRYLKNILIVYYKIKPEKIRVIDNASEITQTEGQKRNAIVTSGRLVPHKRFELVIEAFAKLKTKLPQEIAKTLKLYIIGEGSSKDPLARIIEMQNLQGQVKLLGGFSKDEYLRRLQRAKLFVLASSYEGLPHAIIEAMLSGVPVVASDIPGNREVIEQGKTGTLVKATKESLAKAMQKILRDPKYARKLSENAKLKASKRFAWKTHLKRLIHLFGQELNKTKVR